MYMPSVAVLFCLVLPALSAPAQKRSDLLKVQQYLQFQISDGIAGKALQEVAQKFPIQELRSNLAGVSDHDLSILKAASDAAAAAKTSPGGFDEALKQVGEESDDGQALSVGRTKNSVMQLELSVLALEIEQAKGSGNQEKVSEEQAKLDAMVAQDVARAGDQGQSINFDASSAPRA